MKVERSAILPFSAADMFDVVADIESYPDFLEWCHQSQIESRQENEIVGRLDIRYRKLNISFTTSNINLRPESIEIRLKKGPFSNLSGNWQFIALGESACKVSVTMNFKFLNPVTGMMLNGLFEQLVVSQISAFELRAKQLYG
ncbi:MAG: type II toxin-antitoxin system RatA family toxin [Pseudomonadota bacterium]